MAVNDPLSDMIARIKNAAMRKRSKVSTPASKLRGRVLDVLQDEGYIRGYALVEEAGKHPEFEIELNGEPVIAEIARVAKPTATEGGLGRSIFPVFNVYAPMPTRPDKSPPVPPTTPQAPQAPSRRSGS
jgi:hypothetical protein